MAHSATEMQPSYTTRDGDAQPVPAPKKIAVHAEVHAIAIVAIMLEAAEAMAEGTAGDMGAGMTAGMVAAAGGTTGAIGMGPRAGALTGGAAAMGMCRSRCGGCPSGCRNTRHRRG